MNFIISITEFTTFSGGLLSKSFIPICTITILGNCNAISPNFSLFKIDLQVAPGNDCTYKFLQCLMNLQMLSLIYVAFACTAAGHLYTSCLKEQEYPNLSIPDHKTSLIHVIKILLHINTMFNRTDNHHAVVIFN